MAQKQYKFSLSIHDKHNRQVKKIVDGLLAKGNGALSQSIRDGLRLLNDLRRGNINVLLEMFPDVMDKLCPPSTTNNDDVLREIEALRRELRERPTVQNQEIPDTRNYGIPAMKQSGSGIGTLGGGRVMALPTFDDDDGGEDTIVLNKSTGKMNGENAIAAMLKIAF